MTSNEKVLLKKFLIHLIDNSLPYDNVTDISCENLIGINMFYQQSSEHHKKLLLRVLFGMHYSSFSRALSLFIIHTCWLYFLQFSSYLPSTALPLFRLLLLHTFFSWIWLAVAVFHGKLFRTHCEIFFLLLLLPDTDITISTRSHISCIKLLWF